MHNTAPYSIVQCSTARHSMARHGTARHGTARHCTVLHLYVILRTQTGRCMARRPRLDSNRGMPAVALHTSTVYARLFSHVAAAEARLVQAVLALAAVRFAAPFAVAAPATQPRVGWHGFKGGHYLPTTQPVQSKRQQNTQPEHHTVAPCEPTQVGHGFNETNNT